MLQKLVGNRDKCGYFAGDSGMERAVRQRSQGGKFPADHFYFTISVSLIISHF